MGHDAHDGAHDGDHDGDHGHDHPTGLRARWIGHALRAECEVVVGADLSPVEGHRIAEEAMRRLVHEVPRLTSALVHADPEGEHTHAVTAHHRL